MDPPRIKCDVVGDNTVGKTSLLITFTTNQFPSHYIPNTFEGHADYRTVDGARFLFELWDVTAEEPNDRLHQLAYPRTDVFVLCFSLVDPNSYERVRAKWAPELAHCSPDVPVLVVGTKLDLREDLGTVDTLHSSNMSPIQHHQGMAMSKDIGAKLYLECSALTNFGVEAIFEQAMRLALYAPRRGQREPQRRRKCVIL